MKLTRVPKPNNDVIAGRTAMRQGTPWIVPEAFEFLQKIVRDWWQIYEWGSGGSTIWFARHCKYIVTVEHRPRWLRWTTERLKKEGLQDKCHISFQTEEVAYADDILDAEDGLFHLVFVDGKYAVRKRCIKNCLSKVKWRGWILLDNANRIDTGLLRDWPETRFETEPYHWLGKEDQWATSFFRKPKNNKT